MDLYICVIEMSGTMLGSMPEVVQIFKSGWNPFHTHVKAITVRSCFATLRQIHSVRRSLSQHALLTLVRALVVSKVDYTAAPCWPVCLQSYSWADYSLSWTLPLVWSATPEDQSTSLRCITIFTGCRFLSGSNSDYRPCVLTFRCLHGSAPSYLANSLHRTVDFRCRWSSASAFIRRDHELMKTFLFRSIVTMDIIINLFHPCTFLWPSTHILLTM